MIHIEGKYSVCVAGVVDVFAYVLNNRNCYHCGNQNTSYHSSDNILNSSALSNDLFRSYFGYLNTSNNSIALPRFLLRNYGVSPSNLTSAHSL